MTRLRIAAALLIAASFAAGTLSDHPREPLHIRLGGYRVLAVDFHVHTFPLSWATLPPWDTVREARLAGLDVIAVTPHNHAFSSHSGIPLVLAGEEIVSTGYHLLAVGIHRTIAWNETAASAIDQIHNQGGIAIAAHPVSQSWPAYDSRARAKLDATEVIQPVAWRSQEFAAQLRQFYASAHLTAIGDSDYHGFGPPGICRTYVFAKQATEEGVLEAVRAGRTVVYDGGRTYGDPALIALAAQDGRLPKLESAPPPIGFLQLLTRIAGIAGLLLAVFSGTAPTCDKASDTPPRR